MYFHIAYVFIKKKLNAIFKFTGILYVAAYTFIFFSDKKTHIIKHRNTLKVTKRARIMWKMLG